MKNPLQEAIQLHKQGYTNFLHGNKWWLVRNLESKDIRYVQQQTYRLIANLEGN